MSDVIPPRRVPVVTIALVALNTAVFFAGRELDRQPVFELAQVHALAMADVSLARAASALLAHDGWAPLVGNMVCLWLFGQNIEDAMGRGPFLAFYASAGVAAGLLLQALAPLPAALPGTAGGAVAAVLGAYFVLFPRSQILIAVFLVLHYELVEVPAIVVLGVWLVIQLLNGLALAGSGAPAVAASFVPPAAGLAAGLGAGAILRRRWRWDGR